MRKAPARTWIVEAGPEILCQVQDRTIALRRTIKVLAEGRVWLFRQGPASSHGFDTFSPAQGTLEGEKAVSVSLIPHGQDRELIYRETNFLVRPHGSRTGVFLADECLLEFSQAWRNSEVDAGIVYNFWPHRLPDEIPAEILFALPIVNSLIYNRTAS